MACGGSSTDPAPAATPKGLSTKESKVFSRQSRVSVKSRYSAKFALAVTDFADDDDLDIFQELRDEHDMLLKRVEILEARQRQLFKWHIPLVLILFYAMQVGP